MLRAALNQALLVVASAAIAGTAVLAQPAVPALNPADIDTTCTPCDNFYKFATGGWTKSTPIPAAFSVWSSFDELTQRNYQVVRGILETSARQAATTNDVDALKLGRVSGEFRVNGPLSNTPEFAAGVRV